MAKVYVFFLARIDLGGLHFRRARDRDEAAYFSLTCASKEGG